MLLHPKLTRLLMKPWCHSKLGIKSQYACLKKQNSGITYGPYLVFVSRFMILNFKMERISANLPITIIKNIKWKTNVVSHPYISCLLYNIWCFRLHYYLLSPAGSVFFPRSFPRNTKTLRYTESIWNYQIHLNNVLAILVPLLLTWNISFFMDFGHVLAA